MTSLEIPIGDNTPSVSWVPATATFHIAGKCFPENALKFYGPLLKFLDSLDFNNEGTVVFSFQFEYLSSSSLISLLELLRAIERKNSTVNPLVIDWRYENDDEDMYKLGLDYNRLIALDFQLSAV